MSKNTKAFVHYKESIEILAISKQKTALPASRRQKLRNQGKVFFKMHAIVYFLTEIKIGFLTRLLLFRPFIFLPFSCLAFQAGKFNDFSGYK